MFVFISVCEEMSFVVITVLAVGKHPDEAVAVGCFMCLSALVGFMCQAALVGFMCQAASRPCILRRFLTSGQTHEASGQNNLLLSSNFFHPLDSLTIH